MKLDYLQMTSYCVKQLLKEDILRVVNTLKKWADEWMMEFNISSIKLCR